MQLGLNRADLEFRAPGHEQWKAALVEDLKEHRVDSIVIAGEWQPPKVHALAHALNQQLGNVGKTVFYSESAEANPVNQRESLRELLEPMKASAEPWMNLS